MTRKPPAPQLPAPQPPGSRAVDEYIAGFPPDIQARLRAVRATVRAAAPKAEERISYRMPALFQDGAVIYFAAFKHHLGLFPPVADPKVRARVARYAGPKGNLQFPYSEPIPTTLIAAVVRSRLKENAARAAKKRPSAKTAPPNRAPEDRAPGQAASVKRRRAAQPRERHGVTEDGFRRVVLALEGAVEGAHMGHPDFRVNNRIFASLHHDRSTGGVMLNPDQQAEFLREHPDAFTPASGAWGRGGATTVRLAAVSLEALGEALTLGWQNAVAKGTPRGRR